VPTRRRSSPPSPRKEAAAVLGGSRAPRPWRARIWASKPMVLTGHGWGLRPWLGLRVRGGRLRKGDEDEAARWRSAPRRSGRKGVGERRNGERNGRRAGVRPGWTQRRARGRRGAVRGGGIALVLAGSRFRCHGPGAGGDPWVHDAGPSLASASVSLHDPLSSHRDFAPLSRVCPPLLRGADLDDVTPARAPRPGSPPESARPERHPPGRLPRHGEPGGETRGLPRQSREGRREAVVVRTKRRRS